MFLTHQLAEHRESIADLRILINNLHNDHLHDYNHLQDDDDDDEYQIGHSHNGSRYLPGGNSGYVNAVGDGVTDDTRAIQNAINKAHNNKKDGIVKLRKGTFLITNTLVLKGGVTLQGQGSGSSPLAIQFDAGGSVIAYCGENYAIKVNGHSAAIENLAVYDWQQGCENTKGEGGVIVSANNRLVESFVMRNVLIYWFMEGTSLKLEAKNAGGIGYASFENLRLRHAKVGLHLSAIDEQSFVNSNSFHDGAISGGITDAAVMATGPGACNGNTINGMVIEPPSTSLAHVYVSGSKTSIIMNDVRLEGTAMASDNPLVIVEEDSYGNVMNGLLGHTFVQADLNRNPGITFASNKMVGALPAPHNMFWNAAFHGIGTNEQSIPGWDLTGSGSSSFNIEVISSSEEADLYPDHKILRVVQSNSETLKMEPSNLPLSNIHSFCTFGIYAKSNTAGSIVAAMKYESGSIISSSSHTGSGKWELIGMSSLFDKMNGPQPYFFITGNDIMISAPTFTWGYGSSKPGSELLSSSGARMAGLLTMNLIKVSPPEAGGFWVLPREGNIFEISPFTESSNEPCNTSYVYVTRINHSGTDRFHIGSVITLLFPSCGGCVPCLGLTNGAYISLLGGDNFAPAPSASHSSISLLSRGSGTWSEISRNTA